MSKPLMAKATAVWLVDNSTLSFVQIADFCGPNDYFLDAGGVLMSGGDPDAELVGLDGDGLVEGDREGADLVARDDGGGDFLPFAGAPELDFEIGDDVLGAIAGE